MELISLLNYVIGILSLWLGFNFVIFERKNRIWIGKWMIAKHSSMLLRVILLIGLIAHTYYITETILRNDLQAVTFFQPSRFIMQPVFALCFKLEDMYYAFNSDWNQEYTGDYLKAHTKNLSDLVHSIRFLDKNYQYRQLNASQLAFEGQLHHFRYANIEIEFFFYFEYKCYEFKHHFEFTELRTEFPLDTVFLQFDLVDLDFELMFYPNRSWSLDNRIYIPSYSFTVLRYIAVYTIPVYENLTFCFYKQDSQSDALIEAVRSTLANNEHYKISTKLLPLTHNYFKHPIRDDIFYNALNQASKRSPFAI